MEGAQHAVKAGLGLGRGDPSGEDHIDDADGPLPDASSAARFAAPAGPENANSVAAAVPPPIRVISGSSGGGGEAPPYGGLQDVPDNGGDAARFRQVPAAASPSAAAVVAGPPAAWGSGRPTASPRAAPSPRRGFDLEQHLAAVQAALPVSPNRSTAARAAVARATGYDTLLPSGAAGDVLDEEETVEDILDECISRGACT
ncbi:hypothetical protein PLESTF_001423000 [Pleodorina starrii]|nr:hypothetical protein PLESTF_001423000 [Pleodorina starrii]